MSADPLFYEIFKEIPELFFELIEQPEKDPSIYKFSAQEIKQRSFRLDGLLSTLEAAPNEPIYIIEAQSYQDDNFYNQFVAKVILYLTQYQPANPEWYAVVIYDRKSHEGNFPEYLNFFRAHLRCFYLDELAKTPKQSLAVGVMRLIVENKSKEKTGELARQLMSQAQQELSDATLAEKVLEFIKTVVIDKFTNLSREELEAMLNLESLKKSKVYQEGKEEGVLETKLETIPILLELGLTIEQIAQRLKLDVEIVRNNTKG
ncbi:Rpn family recombination-promoting nuclease/putative transposase [Iningainema tapete]|uniref:Rpn family recombination-promoting nuclease/putative transposase n=1 Tax=Iningainema tapete BLCC-T55 TaxID=2748662 RepID=A0A8J6XJS0_9CYAN|nr:Rpn family recombination-promoting nuclease/putative transposase [Iningainema tapete]MBD2771637.1 Rpn family recombination-promoting nuclease/putative transposase [Iningainema tapete BLCC-T55]